MAQTQEHEQLWPALTALREGGVIAYPTESVWGLGCDPNNHSAFQRLLRIKQRAAEKGVILVASSINQLGSLQDSLSAAQRQTLQTPTEFPTTWLIPANDTVPDWIRGEHSTVAIRISSHPIVMQLCNAFNGMIVSSSANRAGLDPAKTYSEAYSVFADEVDAYVQGETGGALQPSQIIDLQTGARLR
jgi:L-threonylcarbamoyladenylate synthase